MAASQFATVNDVLKSFNSKPMGQEAGDPTSGVVLNRNEASEYVKCFVRNWSGTKERQYIKETISWRQGGQRAATEAKKLGEDFQLQNKRAEAYAGQDPSVIDTAVVPRTAVLLFDNKRFEIPFSKDPKKEPEWLPIPQGVMDLYYGNPDRLESEDHRERTLEIESVRSRRKDYCVRLNQRGENTNPFGYLEFKREIILPTALAIDTDQVYADDYVEV